MADKEIHAGMLVERKPEGTGTPQEYIFTLIDKSDKITIRSIDSTTTEFNLSFQIAKTEVHSVDFKKDETVVKDLALFPFKRVPSTGGSLPLPPDLEINKIVVTINEAIAGQAVDMNIRLILPDAKVGGAKVGGAGDPQ